MSDSTSDSYISTPSSPRSMWVAYIAVLLATFFLMISVTFAVPALPYIQKHFDISIGNAAWIKVAFGIGYILMQPIFGRVADISGRKMIVVLGIGLFAFGSLIAYLTQNYWIMVFGRLLNGVGVAAVTPAGLAYASQWFQPQVRGRALGLWGVLSAFGAVIGPALGGFLVDAFGWQFVFIISTALALIGLFLVVPLVPKSNPQKGACFDYSGTVAFVIGVTSLVVLPMLNQSGVKLDATNIILFVLAVAGIAALILIERKKDQPLIDVKFLASRVFGIPTAIEFCTFILQNGFIYATPFLLTIVMGKSAGLYGIILAGLFVTLTIFSYVGGWLSDRYPPKYPVIAGSIIISLSALMYLMVKADSSPMYLTLIFAVHGIGLGLNVSPLVKTIVTGMDPRKMGSATANYSMFRELAGPFGAAIALTTLGNRTEIHSAQYFIAKVREAGVPESMLQALAGAGPGIAKKLDPGLAASLQAAGINTQELQTVATKAGMAGASADIGWILLIISLVPIFLLLFYPKPQAVETKIKTDSSPVLEA